MPPWAIGASRPSGISRTKSRACATSSACHSSSSVASGLPYRRLEATVPENRYGFCGTRPTVRDEQLRVQVADVHAVDEHRAAGRVEQPGDQVEQRRLAAAGAADDRGRLARPGGQVDAAQHRLLGARVAELDAAQLEQAVHGRQR